jgi:hypothetical protein
MTSPLAPPMTSETAPQVERLPWPQAVARMDRRQGEHVTLIGPTGAGKTEAIARLLETDPWWVYFSTKRRDTTVDTLRGMKPRTIHLATDINPEVGRRYILAPKWNRRMSADAQNKRHAATFTDALNGMFWMGGWTAAIDEGEYLYRLLQVQSPIDRQLTQGRSQGNSVIMGTQRPRYVTLHAYEQATHLLMFRMSDLGNIMRAAELAGVNREAVADTMASLSKYDILYVNTVTGQMFITNTRWE